MIGTKNGKFYADFESGVKVANKFIFLYCMFFIPLPFCTVCFYSPAFLYCMLFYSPTFLYCMFFYSPTFLYCMFIFIPIPFCSVCFLFPCLFVLYVFLFPCLFVLYVFLFPYLFVLYVFLFPYLFVLDVFYCSVCFLFPGLLYCMFFSPLSFVGLPLCILLSNWYFRLWFWSNYSSFPNEKSFHSSRQGWGSLFRIRTLIRTKTCLLILQK